MTAVLTVSSLAVAAGGWLVVAQPGGGSGVSRPRLGPEMPATAMSVPARPANNSPMLRADPTNERFVVLANRVDAPQYVCSLQLSGDGGRTWLPANPVPTLPAGAEKCFGGEVAFQRDGRLQYLFVGLVGEGNEPMGVFLTSSADRGRTFSPPRQVLGPRNFSVRMALDPTIGKQGRIHLVWVHATSDPPPGGFGTPPNPIMAAHSDDGGRTFSTPVQVSDADRQRVLAPSVAVGADHRVHVAYYDLLDDARDYQALEGPVWDGKWSLVVTTSRDGGRSFTRGVVADAEVVPHARVIATYIMPPAALAARDDLVCLAWTDARSGDADVWARCSQDAGRRWHKAQRLNDDPAGTGHWQYLPGLDIAPGGRLDAVFYDRRKDRQNLNNDIVYTFSDDGGASFTANVQLNRDGSSIALVGARYTVVSAAGQYDFGNRMAVLSRRHEVIAAWTDTRNSAPETTGQDIFTTVIAGMTPDGNAAPALLGGALLVLAGLVGLGGSWRRRFGGVR